MTQAEFIIILERQQSSGLSIKDFCSNESYTESSFHYWKSKFGMCRPYRVQSGGEMVFSPINLTSAGKPSLEQTGKVNQIVCNHPAIPVL